MLHFMQPPFPFIVGVPHSGTTLLRLMLDSHPDLSIPAETGFLPDARRILAAGMADAREAFFRIVTLSPAWSGFRLDADAFRASLEAIEPFDLADGVRSFYRLCAARSGKPRFGDRTPSYGSHLDAIQSVLPEARFIHVIRDGRDAALSVTGLWFAPEGEIESLAADWRGRILRTRQLSKGCAHYLEVRYERLITDPPAELRRVCEFIELPYDASMERFHERQDPDGRPHDPSLVERWRRDMGADMRGRFEAVAGDLLTELGYGTGGPAPAKPGRRLSSFFRQRRLTRESPSDP